MHIVDRERGTTAPGIKKFVPDLHVVRLADIARACIVNLDAADALERHKLGRCEAAPVRMRFENDAAGGVDCVDRLLAGGVFGRKLLRHTE